MSFLDEMVDNTVKISIASNKVSPKEEDIVTSKVLLNFIHEQTQRIPRICTYYDGDIDLILQLNDVTGNETFFLDISPDVGQSYCYYAEIGGGGREEGGKEYHGDRLPIINITKDEQLITVLKNSIGL